MHGLLIINSNRIDQEATLAAIGARFPQADLPFVRSWMRPLDGLIRTVLGLEPDTRELPPYRFLFELAGRLKGAYPAQPDPDEPPPAACVPLVLLYVDLLEAYDALDGDRDGIDWADADAVTIQFELAWEKRKYPKATLYLERALERARTNPLRLAGNPHVVRVVNVAHALHAAMGGWPFLIPINPEIAAKFETTQQTLGTAIARAVSLGYLRIVDKHHSYERRKARTFTLNERHPDLAHSKSTETHQCPCARCRAERAAPSAKPG